MQKTMLVALACVCAIAFGCSKGPKKPADLPELNPTTITVTYDDGEPIEGAQVVLRLAKSTGGRVWNVVGTTDASGVATMMTDGNWEGVPAGDYQAMVSKDVSVFEEATTPGGSPTLKSSTRYIDARFNDPRMSGLVAAVQSGSNAFTFQVGEKTESAIETLPAEESTPGAE